jgi:DNA-binding NtrC family response regulator
MKKILIVEDDAELCSSIAGILAEAGYEPHRAGSCREALEKADAEDYDAVLLDMVLPGGSGADCIVELRTKSPRLKIIVVTAFATISNAVDAMRKGASDYLAKPFKIEELLTALRRALEEAGFERRGDRKDFYSILGALSSPIRSEIIRLLHARKKARLGEIAKELGMEDRAKVLFHLKKLRESGLVEYDNDHACSLTIVGEISMECLKVLETHLFSGLK